MTNPMHIDIPPHLQRRPLRHHWSPCVGAGRANEGLRANWQEHLRLAVAHCGFQSVRFHGLFHDDMFVYRERDGRAIDNWQYVDDLFDRMLDMGVRPFVELGFCPGALATVHGNAFWWKGHGSPPTDYSKWAGLVERFVRHCIQRYGLDEVRQWYFEVWNEPNLDFFWAGTRSQYFELYAVTVAAVKGVDAALRVGGPATSNFVPDARFDGEMENLAVQDSWKYADLGPLAWKGVWIEAFLEFCAARKLPVDFVSTHPYPTDYALDREGQRTGRTRPADSCEMDLRWLRKTIDASPYPQAELHLTEWNSSPSHRDHTHDTLLAATYIVKCNIETTGLVDSLAYWTFTDCFEEDGAGDTVFHGGFGLINFQGIPKPAFHAYRFLHALGDEELARGPGWIVTRHRADGRLTALIYHYPDEVREAVPMSVGSREIAERMLMKGTPCACTLRLAGLRPGARLSVETLDQEHGNALAAWDALGRPEPPARAQTRALIEAAWATRKETLIADGDGVAQYQCMLAPWTVMLVEETAG